MKSVKIWNDPKANEFYVTVYASGDFNPLFAVDGYTFTDATSARAKAASIEADIKWDAIA